MSADTVAINSIKPHPKNARKGSHRVLMESLEKNQQYTPIIVHRPTKHIICGSNTWKAAKALGWTEIGVIWIDCSEEQAVQIMVADNKARDNGHVDEDAALQLLQTLPDLEGTGYWQEDLQLPEANLESFDDEPAAGTGEEREEQPVIQKPYSFRIGAARGWLSREAFDTWRPSLPKTNTKAVAEVLNRLMLVEEDLTAPQGELALDVEKVKILDLVQYPGNPNHGDIGLIMALLQEHGQYRPIVANRRNSRILKGNHVVQAATRLGWNEVNVSWVDVDTEAERRIVLVDNRSSDLATDDPELLAQAILSLDPRNVLSTGYSLEDLDEIAKGHSLKNDPMLAEARIVIGPLKTKVRLGLLRDLGLTEGQELVEAAAILGIDPAGVLTDVNPANQPL